MFLLDRLRDAGKLSEGEYARAAEAIRVAPDRRPHEVLIEKGFAQEDAVLQLLADEFGMELVDLSHAIVKPETLAVMPTKLVHRKNLMPISRENGTLTVATGDPYDMYAVDELQTLTGLNVVPVLASPREINRLIKQHFGVGGETVSALVSERDEVELLEGLEADDSELAKQAQEASVVKLVNEILVEAANERASDIHIEPEEKTLRIRYRIDGILQTQVLPPEISRFQSAIISRIKIMARLNIAEKRLPQDGRIKMRVSGREIDVRVSIIPMIHGEGIVMRLLDKGRMVFNLANVGMQPDVHVIFKKLIDRPHGIVLVTGPTGSGKSTTLYSALNEIKNDTTKIITVEDPVEYQQPGISQIQTHAKIGLTFSASLRSILRHDPDVILIGEMRDMETAQSAIQASLTGHLVFSTLHTNDAPSAFTRLIDMGVEPFLVASTVEGVMAQRLVRTICADCKAPFVTDPQELPPDLPGLDIAAGTHPPLWRGAGCKACRGSGYRGRTGIHELLVTDDVIKDMVVQRVSATTIRNEAVKRGMKTLRQEGFRKALQGKTTVDEVARVTAGDMSRPMAEYAYEALSKAGQRSTGTLTATSEREAASMLDARGLFPVRVTAGKTARSSAGGGGRVKGRIMATFYSQLADLMHSGVPLLRSLDLLENQAASPKLSATLREVRSQVADGVTLADAMKPYPNAFDELSVSMVKAGQEGGFLEDVLRRIAIFTDHQEDIKGRVIGALAYPVFLAVVGTLVLNFLVIFFVPKFEPIFAKLREKNELPSLTVGLMAVSNTMQSYWWLILLVGFGAWFGYRKWARTASGRLTVDRFKLRLPLFGKLYLALSLSRFTRIFGTMLHNGIPILRALQIAKDSTGNRVLANAIAESAENVTAGQKLAEPFRRNKYIPRDVVEMIAIGEESNSLEKVLIDISDSLEKRSARQLELFVRLLEPIMLLVMAVVTLMVVLGLLLPVFKMSSAVN